jgi:hypothetical protein
MIHIVLFSRDLRCTMTAPVEDEHDVLDPTISSSLCGDALCATGSSYFVSGEGRARKPHDCLVRLIVILVPEGAISITINFLCVVVDFLVCDLG